jgi:hypothetical protein
MATVARAWRPRVEWDDTTYKESHMKRIALIAAAVLAVPAVFAQAYGSSTTTAPTTPMPAGAATSPMPAGAATSSTDASVGSGGVAAPAPDATNTTVSTVPMKSPHLMPGGSMVQHSSNTTTMGSGPGSTQTVTTTYWANVPSGVERRKDFQRWMALK